MNLTSFVSAPRKRFILWLVIGILLLWNVNEVVKIRDAGLVPLYDFAEYWASCRIFLSGGNPYSSSELLTIQRQIGWTAEKPIMMWNPPWTLPLLVPLAWLDYWPSRGLWLLISMILVWAISDWFWRAHGGPVSRRWISWLAPAFYLPVGTALFLGQITPIVLAGVAGFIWALKKNKLFLAGAFTLLIAVKPHLLYLFWLFLILWILRERKWKVLLGGLTSLLIASLLAILINAHVFVDYLRSVTSPSGPQIWQTPTWGVGILMLFPNIGDWVRFLPSEIGIIAAFFLWQRWKFSFDWLKHLSIIMLISVTTSSFTWMFDWVIFLPVVMLILVRFQIQPSRSWWLLGGLIAIQPLLIFSPAISHTNFYTIWMPPALWLLFWGSSVLKLSMNRTV